MIQYMLGLLQYTTLQQEVLRAVVYAAVPMLVFEGRRKDAVAWLKFLLRLLLTALALDGLQALLLALLPAALNTLYMELVVVASYDCLYALLCRRRSFRHRLLKLATILSSSVAVTALTFSFGSWMDSVLDIGPFPVYCFLTLLTILNVVLILRYSVDRIRQLLKGMVIFSVAIDSVVLIALILTLGITFNGETFAGTVAMQYTSMIFFLLYIMVQVTYLSGWMVCRESAGLQELTAERQLQEATQHQLELTQTNMQNLRKLRHDLKNQYAYLEALLDHGEYAKLKETLSEYSAHRLKTESFVDCGNVELSAILTMEATKSQREGIRLDTVVAVPAKLPFSNGVLLSILSNMIDNALEANNRYGIKDDIRVQISLRNDYLYMAVFNRLPENINKTELLKLHSAKGNEAEHGLGTRIIRECAQAAGGEVLFDVQDGEFIVEVLLDMLKEEKEHAGGQSSHL